MPHIVSSAAHDIEHGREGGHFALEKRPHNLVAPNAVACINPPAFNSHIGLILNCNLILTPLFNINGSITIHMGGEHRPKTQSTCTTLSGGIDPLFISKLICIPQTTYITGQQEVQPVQPLPFCLCVTARW